MTSRFPRLNSIIYGVPLAILEERMEAIVDVVERRMEGIFRTPEEIAALKGDRRHNGTLEFYGFDTLQPVAAGPGASQSTGSVIAVINVMGIIAQHAHQVDDISGPGGTSTERLTKSFRAAMADPNVTAIVFNHDSPGGSVSGVQALADEIYASRGKKPIISQVNSQMASAAYWIGAASDEIVITPGGQAGSIGVYMMHKDVSKAAENEGVKVTFIKAGKFKTEGNPFEALGEEAAASFQTSVDSYYSDFTKAVAKFRGASASDVRNGYGEGRMVKDHEAVKAGLADSVGTLDDTLRRVSGQKKKSGARAEAPAPGVLTLYQTNQDDVCKTYLQNKEWPQAIVIDKTFTENPDPVLVVGDENVLTFTFENATAQYQVVADSESGHGYYCTLISGTVQGPPPAPSADESDAWRRRRHAHRQR